MRVLGVEREPGSERTATAGNRYRRRRRRHETDIRAGKDIVVVVVEIERKLVVRGDRSAESVTAVVLQVTNVGSVIATFANHDRRGKIYPLFRFIAGADSVVLELPWNYARECIVGRIEFSVETQAQRAARTR